MFFSTIYSYRKRCSNIQLKLHKPVIYYKIRHLSLRNITKYRKKPIIPNVIHTCLRTQTNKITVCEFKTTNCIFRRIINKADCSSRSPLCLFFKYTVRLFSLTIQLFNTKKTLPQRILAHSKESFKESYALVHNPCLYCNNQRKYMPVYLHLLYRYLQSFHYFYQRYSYNKSHNTLHSVCGNIYSRGRKAV